MNRERQFAISSFMNIIRDRREVHMEHIIDEKKALLQSLQDAGCDEETIHCCMRMADQYSEKSTIPLLMKFRGCLLESIHAEQDKLRVLDHLIFDLKNQNQ